MSEKSFIQTSQTTISRLSNRGSYDKAVIYPILDQTIDITVSYVVDNNPMAIPTGFIRIGDVVYIHGSVKSHFLMKLVSCERVCLTVSMLDGLVLAQTVFHHSFNYRGVVAFARPFMVEDEAEKMEISKAFTDKVLPGRWDDDIQKPTPEELKATAFVGLELLEATAKIRKGGPNGSGKHSAWTGHVPLQRVFREAVPAPEMEPKIEVPDYVKKLYS
ncbi:MAG: pyridoxamine 5'-phosphate oxidase family protein [Cyclobacteriaceae bacterium]